MAKRKQSSISGRLKKAVSAHKNETTTNQGRVDLPAGIKGGIAELSEMYFKEGEKGLFFRASGTVLEPKSFKTENGETVRTEGQTTSQIIMLNTEEKIDKGVDRILRILRTFGVDTSELEDTELEDAVKQLGEEEGLKFRFTTTASEDNSRVWENWNSVIEDGDDSEGYDDEEDDDPTDVDDDEDDDEDIEDDDSDETDEDDEDSEEDEEDDEDLVPEKGEVYDYKPPRKRKAVSCEVVLVSAKTKTVKLKNLSDGKSTYSKVPWDKLEE